MAKNYLVAEETLRVRTKLSVNVRILKTLISPPRS